MRIAATWIPIEQQEPPDSRVVLVVGKLGLAETPNVTAALYSAEAESFFDALSPDWDGELWLRVDGVTHWMLLEALMPEEMAREAAQ